MYVNHNGQKKAWSSKTTFPCALKICDGHTSTLPEGGDSKH